MQRSYGFTLAAVFVALSILIAGTAAAQQVPLLGRAIPKFRDALPIPPVINATTGTPYTITMSEFAWQILPAGYSPTLVWGYNGSYPGPTILAKRGTPVNVTYVNNLLYPLLQSTLHVDQTLHWADPAGLACNMMVNPSPQCLMPYNGPVPATVHLHGGEVPSAFDGGPDTWFTPEYHNPLFDSPAFANTGPGFVTNAYTYMNAQEPTSMFYHDHALGMTRLNVFAGLAGFYLLTGTPGTDEPLNLPGGAYDVGLAIQDRMFDVNGQLLFPSLGVNPSIHPSWIPEFFGDVIVVNGKSWPFMNVEPRRYRLRLLNGSNARFYTLQIMDPATRRGIRFYQIGSDGGYLNTPAGRRTITIAPGERADIVVEFRAYAGKRLTMTNSAPTPFPMGLPVVAGATDRVMQFRVVTPLAGPDTSFDPAVAGCARPTPLVDLKPTVAAPAPGTTVPLRRLTLNENIDPITLFPLEVFLNNSKWGLPFSENPRVGATEVWEIINLTVDTHPIHLHLVQFQLINRQAFNVARYTVRYNAAFPGGVVTPGTGPPLAYGNCNAATPPLICGGNPDPTRNLVGVPILPAAGERGWKDTIQMNPGEITRVVVRWAPQNIAAGGVTPGTNLFPFDPTAGMGVVNDGFGYPGGPGYVWHCHIIDHEDNEMMRPYLVLP